MAEKIKKHKDIVFVLGVGLVLTIAAIAGMSGMVAIPNFASAATTATVGVTATVESWLTITVNPSSVTLSPSLVDTAGTTRIGSSTSNVAIDVGTNSSNGWNIGIKGANNALIYGATGTIASVTASSTLNAGADGYGANATNSLAGVTIGPYYKHWATTDVGEIKTGGQTLASKTTLQAAQTVATMKVYAAATSTKPSGSYTDTITLTVTSGT